VAATGPSGGDKIPPVEIMALAVVFAFAAATLLAPAALARSDPVSRSATRALLQQEQQTSVYMADLAFLGNTTNDTELRFEEFPLKGSVTVPGPVSQGISGTYELTPTVAKRLVHLVREEVVCFQLVLMTRVS
jgi:hypothetical protein